MTSSRTPKFSIRAARQPRRVLLRRRLGLRRALPTLKVVRLRRDPAAVEASILAMRERYHGDRSTWWSLRPADVSAVQDASPEEQVAFQVAHANAALDAAGSDLDVTYGDLCAHPEQTVARICAIVGLEP